MRRAATIGASFLAAVCTPCAPIAFGQAPDAAKPAGIARPKAATPADPDKMERVLGLWEKANSALKTLDVTIFRHDYIVDWDESEYFEGRALLKKPDLAHVDFRKIEMGKDKKPLKAPTTNAWVSVPKERIVCTGSEVRHHDSDTRQIIIYPLDKDRAARATDTVPLSFFFNMQAADAKKRYAMTLIGEDDKTYTIDLKPKLRGDQASFGKVVVQLDRKQILPVRIFLQSPDGKSQRDFRLSAIKPNAEIEEGMFEATTDPSWKERRFGADGLVRILRLW